MLRRRASCAPHDEHGSYMEDQDHWWLSGLHRDVWLYSKPNVAIDDYAVTTDVHDDGTATICLTVSVTVSPATEEALHEAAPPPLRHPHTRTRGRTQHTHTTRATATYNSTSVVMRSRAAARHTRLWQAACRTELSTVLMHPTVLSLDGPAARTGTLHTATTSQWAVDPSGTSRQLQARPLLSAWAARREPNGVQCKPAMSVGRTRPGRGVHT
jgi:hypothetical protein